MHECNVEHAGRVGVGFKPVHLPEHIAARSEISFVELHAENYMGAGGAPHAQLARLRAVPSFIAWRRAFDPVEPTFGLCTSYTPQTPVRSL